MIEILSNAVIPTVIAAILCFGLVRGTDVFSTFVQGAKSGLETSFRILPSLVALMVCIGMFRASGGLDILVHALTPLATSLGAPPELLPLALIRPLSGSGALSIYQSILEQHGPDSFLGRVASVMQGASETTFYTIAVYFGAVGVVKSRYTAACSLVGDFTGFLVSVLMVQIFFP